MNDLKFTLFGIKFEISFLFTLFISLMLLTDKTGKLHLFFVGATLHEAAHIIMMSALKVKPLSVRLIPGGINIAERDIYTPLEQILILIAGPALNLFLALCIKGDFAAINLGLFVFNMLPVLGLDGGRIIEILLLRVFGHRTAETVLKINTFFLAALFAVLFFVLYKRQVQNPSLFIFSLYMLSSLFLKKGIERKG